MAKGNGRQMEKQERTMGEFARLVKMSKQPGYKSNRLVDQLIEEGAIRRAQAEKKEVSEKPVFSSRFLHAFVYGIQK